MRVMAQMAMVMNLDKCIGCHTCSVTCKQAWTNRSGMEYVWFNNVETRPGLGYPRGYQDQEKWKGGWTRTSRGRLTLRAGGRLNKLLNIFSNPKMPAMSDYYEPWTYDYETLLRAPAQKDFPVARPHSLISGKPINIEWSANWDDDLGGSMEHAVKDPMLKGIEDKVKFEFEDTFMFYLPRICEHCLNPSCAASCPSGAIYKREEDGIVLVDQDKCRGWRMCVTGCPYKKVYFNHKTGKAEKCTFCYPRVEVGIPTQSLVLSDPAAIAAPFMPTVLMNLRGAGVPIIGFTWYSLTDQVDWDRAIEVPLGVVNPVGLFDLNRDARVVGLSYKHLIDMHRELPDFRECKALKELLS